MLPRASCAHWVSPPTASVSFTFHNVRSSYSYRGRAAERVDHLHDAADGIHPVCRGLAEAVGHAGDLADLVVVDDVVVDAAVAPGAHAVRVLAGAVVREVERRPVRLVSAPRGAPCTRTGTVAERIESTRQIACVIVGVARVDQPAVLLRGVRQRDRDQPPGAVVLEARPRARRSRAPTRGFRASYSSEIVRPSAATWRASCDHDARATPAGSGAKVRTYCRRP